MKEMDIHNIRTDTLLTFYQKAKKRHEEKCRKYNLPTGTIRIFQSEGCEPYIVTTEKKYNLSSQKTQNVITYFGNLKKQKVSTSIIMEMKKDAKLLNLMKKELNKRKRKIMGLKPLILKETTHKLRDINI